MKIDGSTRLLGLIGQGIAYTLSPKIHNVSVELLGENCVYMPFDLGEDGLDRFLQAMWDAGAVGFNITQPHKCTVASLMGASLNAINVLWRGDQGWLADSTDGVGFWAGVGRLGVHPSDVSRLIVLGNGGVVDSILTSAQAHNIKDFAILRRSDRRDRVINELLEPTSSVRFYDFSPEHLRAAIAEGQRKATLLVQATSAPLHGDRLQALIPGLDEFQGIFVDLVYGHASSLYEFLRDQGLRVQDGLPMLIEQARAAQKLWWGRAAAYEDIERAIWTHA